MKGFDRERLSRLAAELESALRASDDRAAPILRRTLTPLFQRIAAGEVDRAVRVPGGRLFLESELPGDPAVSSLWVSFCAVAEGDDQERTLAFSEACRRAAPRDPHRPSSREERDASAAQAYVLPPDRNAALERARARHQGGEELLDEVFGPERAGLVHLGTTLSPDGAQRRAYAIHGEAGFLMDLAADGTCQRLVPETGSDGFGRLLRSLESESLPERHRVAVDVRSWGEAYAHARDAGAAVLEVREHYDANPRVVLLCERPLERSPAWSPQLGQHEPRPEMAIERATRTYRIRDRRVLDASFVGEPSVRNEARTRASAQLRARLRSSSGVTVLRTSSVLLPAMTLVVALGLAGLVATGNLGVGILALVIGFPAAFIPAVALARKLDFARDARNPWVRLEGQVLTVPVDGTVRRLALADLKASGGYYWHRARSHYLGSPGKVLITAQRGAFLYLRAEGLEIVLHARDGAGDAPALGLRRYRDPPEGVRELRVWTRELVPLIAAVVREEEPRGAGAQRQPLGG